MSIKIRVPGLCDIISIIALLSLVLIQGQGMLKDPGTGWHLMSGKLMSQSMSPLIIDPFLAGGPRSWVHDQWLADILGWAVFSTYNLDVLLVLVACFFYLTFYVVLQFGLQSITGNIVISSFATLMVFKASQIHFILRPAMIGFFFFSVLYIWCVQILDRELLNRRGRIKLFLLPPLFCLWANLHPSFVLGFILLAILFTSLIFRHLFEAPYKKSVLLIIGTIIVGSIGFTLINPYGIRLYTDSILALGGSKFFMRLHDEWRSPDFGELAPRYIYVMLLVVMLGGLIKKRTLTEFDYISTSVFLFFGLVSVRMMPYAAIVMSVPFVRGVLSFRDVLNKSPILANACSRIERRELGTFRGGLGIFACAGLAGLYLTGGSFPSSWNSNYFLEHPLNRPLNHIIETSKNESEIVLAAPPAYGGVISFLTYPKIKTLIDDRNQLVGEKYYKNVVRWLEGGKGWQAGLSKLGADYLLIGVNTTFGSFAQESYSEKIIFEDKKYLVLRIN